MAKIILVGAPRSGKSTYAAGLRKDGIPTFCTDPESLVKDVEKAVTYLPEGLDWSEASQYVLDQWFTMPGPWCIEGIATVRALRKLLDERRTVLLKDVQVLRFRGQHKDAVTKPGQITLKKGIDSIWFEIEPRLKKLVKDGFRIRSVSSSSIPGSS